MAPQTDLRRGMRFRSVLSLSSHDNVSGHSRPISECRASRDYGRRPSNVERKLIRHSVHTGSDVSAWIWFSIELSGGHFIRAGDAENSGSDFGWSSEAGVRFNWTDSDGDINDFKCKLIDLSTIHDNRA